MRRGWTARWMVWLAGGGAAVVMVAMAIFSNQAYSDGNFQWVWLAGALAAAMASVWITAVQQRQPPRAVLAIHNPGGHPLTLAEASLAELGVHPNRFDTGDGPGPYVPRDGDADIAATLRSPVPLVIVHGARLAGASRSLAHHARRLLPRHQVLVYRPDPDVTVAQLVADAARWATPGEEGVQLLVG